MKTLYDLKMEECEREINRDDRVEPETDREDDGETLPSTGKKGEGNEKNKNNNDKNIS